MSENEWIAVFTCVGFGLGVVAAVYYEDWRARRRLRRFIDAAEARRRDA